MQDGTGVPTWFYERDATFIGAFSMEALVGGPVQYRWMYSEERELEKIRSTVRNKARVEGCIAEAYALKEIAHFSSTYFAAEHNVYAPTTRYHIDEAPPMSDLQIFQWKGTAVGASTTHQVSKEEWNKTLLYMYSNMEEI